MAKIKVIKLNEKEQKDLFCAALHLTNYMEDIKENKVGEFTTACKFCTKYGKECAKLAAEGKFNIYDSFKINWTFVIFISISTFGG